MKPSRLTSVAIATIAALALGACSSGSTAAPSSSPATTPSIVHTASGTAITIAPNHLVAGDGLGDPQQLPADEAGLKGLYCAQRAQGAVFTRIDVARNWLQHNPTQHASIDFGDSDRLINPAIACGLKPLVLITGTTPWDRGCPDASSCPREHDQDLEALGRALASQYPNVMYWEGPGNELNFGANNTGGKPNPTLAVHDTDAFGRGLRQSNPKAHVVTPSVGPADANGTDLPMSRYVAEMLDHLPAGTSITDVGVHIGCFPKQPGPDCDYWRDLFDPAGSTATGTSVYQQVVTRAPQLGIIVTEITGGTLDDAGQAATLTNAVKLLSDPRYQNVGPVMWFGWSNWPGYHNGLGDASNQRLRAAYKAFASAHQAG